MDLYSDDIEVFNSLCRNPHDVRIMRSRWTHSMLFAFAILILPVSVFAAPTGVSFSLSNPSIETFDFVEVSLRVASPDVGNPFTEAAVEAVFELANNGKQWKVSGFCDSQDGSLFRVRFMPAVPGDYKYKIIYRQASFERTSSGTFRAVTSHRSGPIRIDEQHPWHFVWEGSGQHYFLNGTTGYFLMGWRDDRVIRYSIERLHRLKVNWMRVTLAGRSNGFVGEPVQPNQYWTASLEPWLVVGPHDFYRPGFDYTRFNVRYWQRWDDMLRFARERDFIISVCLDMNDNPVHPAAGGEDERRFIHYAVNRFGAFSNIVWDLGDDLDGYRDEKWSHETGTLIEEWDPAKHLASSHPALDMHHQDRSSDWFGFTSYQDWSRGREQHEVMLRSRQRQEASGRIIPQTNQEYGYEDHYPSWALPPPAESADVLRRTAWDIVMAGGYQTAGESARRGTNIWPDSGGGWLNGRGDDTMTMFLGYGHMVDFFTSFDWWKTNPHDELVDGENYCLADPGKIYAVYLPHAGKVTIQLERGNYLAAWFDPRSGETISLPDVYGDGAWTSPDPEAANPDNWPTTHDWALLLLKE